MAVQISRDGDGISPAMPSLETYKESLQEQCDDVWVELKELYGV